jgi:serine-type D-Ala-D-Ala carboxypeptidase
MMHMAADSRTFLPGAAGRMAATLLLAVAAAACASSPALLPAPVPADPPDVRPLEITTSVDESRETAPGVAGFSAARFALVDSVVIAALRDGAAPGAALVVGRHGRVVRLRGYGRTDWDLDAPYVSDSTLYDLASLTKAMGTATVAIQLIGEGRIHLDVPIHRYLTSWPGHGRYGEITVRHLLGHSSGLPPGRDIWRVAAPRADRIASLAGVPVRQAPGTVREYSDLGLILLGALLEEVTGSRLDDLLHARVFAPLAMRDTRFNPLTQHAGGSAFALQRIAPTERDGFVRMTHVHGIVHDLNAWALDGVAGHAGLFSSARDMAVYAQALLDAALGRESALFPAGSFAEWLHDQRAFDRPLGWDVPTGASSSAGLYFTASSFGHTGFTGTSIWVDPERGLFVVLLTNRLNPSARNQRHVQLRRDLHNAVQLAIEDMPVTLRDPPACDRAGGAPQPLPYR